MFEEEFPGQLAALRREAREMAEFRRLAKIERAAERAWIAEKRAANEAAREDARLAAVAQNWESIRAQRQARRERKAAAKRVKAQVKTGETKRIECVKYAGFGANSERMAARVIRRRAKRLRRLLPY